MLRATGSGWHLERAECALLTTEEIADITFIAHGHGLGICLVCLRLGSTDCRSRAVCRQTDPPPAIPPAAFRTWKTGQSVDRDIRAYRMDRSLPSHE